MHFLIKKTYYFYDKKFFKKKTYYDHELFLIKNQKIMNRLFLYTYMKKHKNNNLQKII